MHVQIWWGKLLVNSNLEDEGVVRLIFRCNLTRELLCMEWFTTVPISGLWYLAILPYQRQLILGHTFSMPFLEQRTSTENLV
jgi:hypothetical protein